MEMVKLRPAAVKMILARTRGPLRVATNARSTTTTGRSLSEQGIRPLKLRARAHVLQASQSLSQRLRKILNIATTPVMTPIPAYHFDRMMPAWSNASSLAKEWILMPQLPKKPNLPSTSHLAKVADLVNCFLVPSGTSIAAVATAVLPLLVPAIAALDPRKVRFQTPAAATITAAADPTWNKIQRLLMPLDARDASADAAKLPRRVPRKRVVVTTVSTS